MELHDALRIFRRYFWFISLLTLLAAASAWAVSTFIMVPHYTSTTMILISRKLSSMENGNTNDALLDSQTISLFTKVAASESVALQILSELPLDMNAEELQKHISVNTDSQTGILDITVESDSADMALDIIEAYIRALTTETSKMFLNVDIHIVDPPKPASKPTGPIIPLNVGLSALGGLFAGMLLAILFYIKEQTKSDLSALKKFPELFVIGFMLKNSKKSPYFPLSGSRAGEAVRMMGANLQYLAQRDELKTILVSSPYPAEGVTTVTVNLAASMVRLGKKVLVVDCSGASQSASWIGRQGPGNQRENLCCVIGGYTVKKVPETGFDVTPAPRNENGILYAKMRQLFDTFDHSYDMILLDCPPVLTGADTLLLSQLFKKIVLVTDYRKLASGVLNLCIQRLAQIDTAVLGIIVNRMPRDKVY